MSLNLSFTSPKLSEELRKVYWLIKRQYIAGVHMNERQFIEMHKDKDVDLKIIQAKDSSGTLLGAIVGGNNTLVTTSKREVNKLTPAKLFSQDHLDHENHVRELDLLAVAPQHRKKGLGADLVQRFETDCRSKEVEYIYGSLTPSPDLIRFYQKLGYTVGELLPRFYDLDWSNDGLKLYDPNIAVKNPPLHFYKAL